eukprot:jgi/Ulvmu1/12847/UM098_0032.1
MMLHCTGSQLEPLQECNNDQAPAGHTSTVVDAAIQSAGAKSGPAAQREMGDDGSLWRPSCNHRGMCEHANMQMTCMPAAVWTPAYAPGSAHWWAASWECFGSACRPGMLGVALPDLTWVRPGSQSGVALKPSK